ncbi:MAG: hypothetical protein COY58_05315 [Gammaproteobacteria bacterium CG_4_10_14_0_8_um_filter_38_16]|nr:MAG: hypothetical protein COY58_05315 [Gammaproteobacteria bacterium CG_4_10_14_0_8_um_filter_38_16]PJA02857.1 MAG: hypothetical protein COX72_08700 [Gammaproteobacteria bacterium CG_4_10_14_0_2_um_filter_38_22]PJB10683.1 MAG: hypothetical protein CO120_03560 [Gammaproteobacteria bacterium CG_4_9_14_3_um_filter_38_9]
MKLRVLLFNYIPLGADDEQQTLIARIEAEFEKLHPFIDLEVRPISYEYDLYNIEQLRILFTEYDLIELDVTIMQEWLINESLISPFHVLPNRSWHSAALESIRVNEDFYGVPSWLCSHFVISKTGTITPEKSLVDNIIKHNATTIYDFSGSWSKLGLYLDGILDEHNAITLTNVNAFNRYTIENMTYMLLACSKGLCLKGNFSNPMFSAKHFSSMTSQTPILIGYLESILHSLGKSGELRQNYSLDTLHLSRRQSSPILFVDAWVKSNQCNNTTCNRMAQLFTDYITSKETQSWIISSGDKQGANITPRYLIPANNDTLTTLNKNLHQIEEAYSLLKTAKSVPKEVSYALGSHKKYYVCMIESKMGLLDSDECKHHRAPSAMGPQFIKDGAPSFLIGLAAGWTNTFFSKIYGRAKGERVGIAATTISMYALDYSPLNIAVFIGFQFLFRSAGLPNKYANYLSYSLMLLSCVINLDPQLMLMNILLGVISNGIGSQIGNFAGEKSARYATLFFRPVIVLKEENRDRAIAARSHVE